MWAVMIEGHRDRYALAADWPVRVTRLGDVPFLVNGESALLHFTGRSHGSGSQSRPLAS
jgi:hypothetical protein